MDNKNLPAVMPVRRDLHFSLPLNRVGDWHSGHRQLSHFFNALSLFFPHGERFFIHSVRNYRGRVQDPTLNKAVTAFIGQEAMHSREHAECNEAIGSAGLPAVKLEARVGWIVALLKKLPFAVQLAITIALEHLTAILANTVLEDRRVMAGAEPAYATMWRWHALEETEHKAVCYDVWQTVVKQGLGSYLLRCTTLVAATLIFAALVWQFQRALVAADPAARAEHRGGWRTLGWLLRTPGPLSRALRDWGDYFRPGFHPWMHDNREFLAETAMLDQTPYARAA